MSGFLSRLFGGRKQKEVSAGGEASMLPFVENLLKTLIEKSNLDLNLELNSGVEEDEERISIELSGDDEHMLTENDGALLDSIQLFVKRVTQHQYPEARVDFVIDTGGYRQENQRLLIELAEKFRDRVLENGRSVYSRAMPPKDRKVIHQFLSSDERVRSRSVGEGLYKKVKIYPAKSGDGNKFNSSASQDRSFDDDVDSSSESDSDSRFDEVSNQPARGRGRITSSAADAVIE